MRMWNNNELRKRPIKRYRHHLNHHEYPLEEDCQEAFIHLEAAMDIFREDEPNRDRTLTSGIHCNGEPYPQQKKKHSVQLSLDRFF